MPEPSPRATGIDSPDDRIDLQAGRKLMVTIAAKWHLAVIRDAVSIAKPTGPRSGGRNSLVSS
jgi:hypothetical protein